MLSSLGTQANASFGAIYGLHCHSPRAKYGGMAVCFVLIAVRVALMCSAVAEIATALLTLCLRVSPSTLLNFLAALTSISFWLHPYPISNPLPVQTTLIPLGCGLLPALPAPLVAERFDRDTMHQLDEVERLREQLHEMHAHVGELETARREALGDAALARLSRSMSRGSGANSSSCLPTIH